MEIQKFKHQLKTVYTGMHQYAIDLLANLPEDVYNWKPENTQARSIYSYFRHLVNVEIYWLNALKKHNIPYFGKDLTLKDLLEHFGHLEVIYSKLIDNCETDDLTIVSSVYEYNSQGEIEKIKQKGTVAWTVIRVSLHCFHHMSQISHMLGSQGIKPKIRKENTWWEVSENIINIAGLIQE